MTSEAVNTAQQPASWAEWRTAQIDERRRALDAIGRATDYAKMVKEPEDLAFTVVEVGRAVVHGLLTIAAAIETRR